MALQFSTSVSLMARMALEISVSPVLQKRSKPPPEPIESMVMLAGEAFVFEALCHGFGQREDGR